MWMLPGRAVGALQTPLNMYRASQKKYPQAPMAIGRFCMKRLASSWSYAKASYEQFFWDALYSYGKKFKIRIISNEKNQKQFSCKSFSYSKYCLNHNNLQSWSRSYSVQCDIYCTVVQCTVCVHMYLDHLSGPFDPLLCRRVGLLDYRNLPGMNNLKQKAFLKRILAQ